MTKTEYVHNYLAPLVKVIDKSITAVTYSRFGDIEYIYLLFKSGYIKINVTGAGLKSLAEEVIRRIA